MSTTGSHERWRDELAAYLLGSLSDDDARQMERHLQDCGECRQELRWLRPALEVLPESVEPLEPPPELRQRIMSEVESGAAAATAPAAPKPRHTRFRLWALRPAVGLAATAVVVAGIVGYTVGGGEGDQTSTLTGKSALGGAVEAKLERDGDSGTLVLANLSQPQPGKAYQAWVQNGNRVTPTSPFLPKADGTASAAIMKGLDGADAVMVTVEPKGGSPQPTSPAIARVKLD